MLLTICGLQTACTQKAQPSEEASEQTDSTQQAQTEVGDSVQSTQEETAPKRALVAFDLDQIVTDTKNAIKFPVEVQDGLKYYDILVEDGKLVNVYQIIFTKAKEIADSEGIRKQEKEQLKNPDIKDLLDCATIVYRYIDEHGKFVVDHEYTNKK